MAVSVCALDRPFAVSPSTVSSAWTRYQWTDKYTRRGGGGVGMQQPSIRTFLLSLVSMFLPKLSETDSARVARRPDIPKQSLWSQFGTSTLTRADTVGPCMGSFFCMTMYVSSCCLMEALALLTGLPIVLHPVEHISQPRTVQEFTDAPIKVREGIPLEIICRPWSMPIRNRKCLDQPEILFFLQFWLWICYSVLMIWVFRKGAWIHVFKFILTQLGKKKDKQQFHL